MTDAANELNKENDVADVSVFLRCNITKFHFIKSPPDLILDCAHSGIRLEVVASATSLLHSRLIMSEVPVFLFTT